MNLAEVRNLLEAEVLCGLEKVEAEVEVIYGADLMSDVLASAQEKMLLLTGLTNIQVIRTADMIDLVGIVFVGGKRPAADLVNMAESKGIPLFVTRYPMYEACGILYQQFRKVL